MLYQETFQNGESTSTINVSSGLYISGNNKKANENIESGFPNHCHSFFEIQYFIFGNGEMMINGKRVQTLPNSMVLVPPLCVHGQVSYEKSSNMVIQFGYKFLNRNASTLKKNSLLMPSGKLLENGIILIEKGSLLDQYLNKIKECTPSVNTPVKNVAEIPYSAEYEWKLNSLTLGIVSLLLDMGDLSIEENCGDSTEVVKIQSVLNQLITHPEEKLSMKKAAQMACMSYSNFSRHFTRIIGRSYVDFCNDVRIHRAEELLRTTNISITELSEMLGFGSTSYFNRIFKNYNGNTPMYYRSTEPHQ